MEKIAVFGASGFIGSKFCAMYPENTRVIDARENEEYIDEKDALYLVSTTSNYNVFTDPLLDIDTNLGVLMKQLPYTDENGVFNFISSWFVYGKHGHYVTEDSFCDPKGFYSITKRCAEQLIESYCTTFNRRYRILRLSNVIGRDPRANPKKNALEFLISKIKNNEDVDIYEGDNYRNYLDVEDCCRAIKLVTEQGDINGIYNIGSEESYRLYDIIQYAMGKANSTSKINIIETPKFHSQVQTKNFFMDIRKLQKLGFQQKYDIYQTIDRLL